MKIKFLGQGLDRLDNLPIGSILIDEFNNNKHNSFVGIVAFASKAGIEGLSEHIIKAKKYFNELKLYKYEKDYFSKFFR